VVNGKNDERKGGSAMAATPPKTPTELLEEEMATLHGNVFITIAGECKGGYLERNERARRVLDRILCEELGFPGGVGLIEAKKQLAELRQRDPARPSCCASGEDGEAD
jgi:hypothetical protein